MRIITSALFIVLASSVAAAEPRAYLEGGSEVGGYTVDWLYGGFTLEGGIRLGDTPLYVRGRVSTGEANVQRDMNADYTQARVGGEFRRSVGARWFRVFGGVDAALERDAMTRTDDMATHTELATILVPRAGLQIGNRIYGRLAAELPLYVSGSHSEVGVAGAAGLGVAF